MPAWSVRAHPRLWKARPRARVQHPWPTWMLLAVGTVLGFAAAEALDAASDPILERFGAHWVARNRLAVSFHRRLLGTVTLYSSGQASTGKRPGMRFYGYTHSGLPAGLGIAAADPRYYPEGTLIKVRDQYFLVADTGSAIKGPDRFDLYVPSDEVADRAGSQLEWVEVVR